MALPATKKTFLLLVSCFSLVSLLMVLLFGLRPFRSHSGNFKTAGYRFSVQSYKINAHQHEQCTPKNFPNIRALKYFTVPDNLSMINTGKRIKEIVSRNKKEALMTLFTSWTMNKFVKDSDKQNWSYNIEEQLVHNMTVINWLSFHPYIIPVIFTNESYLASEVSHAGWEVLPVRYAGTDGVPVLKDMFLSAMSNFKTLFYGYSNSDILYTNALLETLLSVAESLDNSINDPVFITGKRTNVSNMTKTYGSTWANILRTARCQGEIFTPRAADYFITNPVYPWDYIPPLVIGHVAYDTWLIYNARKCYHKVIDASGTLLAVHQTTSQGNKAEHSLNDYNTELLRDMNVTYNHRAGRVDCCEYATKFDGRGSIMIAKRNVSRRCYFIEK